NRDSRTHGSTVWSAADPYDGARARIRGRPGDTDFFLVPRSAPTRAWTGRGEATLPRMGLEVSVGARSVAPGDSEALERYRAGLDRLSAVLAERGIVWHEPTTEVPVLRAHAGGFPYSYLPYLRRALALLNHDRPVT